MRIKSGAGSGSCLTCVHEETGAVAGALNQISEYGDVASGNGAAVALALNSNTAPQPE